MRWIFWRCTPSSAPENKARLQEGNSVEIGVFLEAQESSPETPAVLGLVLSSATEETGRDRFFRRHRGKADTAPSPSVRAGKSPETSESSVEAPQAGPRELLLCAPPDFGSSANPRIAYFTRGCYAVSGRRAPRLRAPAVNRSTTQHGFAAGGQRKALLNAGPENYPAQPSAKEE
jgi:hypothetical protein